MSSTSSPLSSSPIKLQKIPTNLKGVFVGSGSDGMNDSRIAQSILDLVVCDNDEDVERITSPSQNTSASSIKPPLNVVYVGTATYDLPGPKRKQTQRFVEAGCNVCSLDVASSQPNDMERIVDNADIIIVSGGNTLFAVDRWKQAGLDELLHKAADRGAVLTGGSAGAICWFDGGHSDSMDPDSFWSSMLGNGEATDEDNQKDESSSAPSSIKDAKAWEYIRVDGLGFFPGLICPHHDKIQSNGVLRATDFDAMLLRHPGETGIGIDHWAALEVKGDRFRVLRLEEKKGSVLPDKTFSSDQNGVPGIWIKEVDREGIVRTRLCPDSGRLDEILRLPTEIIKDERVTVCRKLNPLNIPKMT